MWLSRKQKTKTGSLISSFHPLRAHLTPILPGLEVGSRRRGGFPRLKNRIATGTGKTIPQLQTHTPAIGKQLWGCDCSGLLGATKAPGTSQEHPAPALLQQLELLRHIQAQHQVARAALGFQKLRAVFSSLSYHRRGALRPRGPIHRGEIHLLMADLGVLSAFFAHWSRNSTDFVETTHHTPQHQEVCPSHLELHRQGPSRHLVAGPPL